MLPSGAHRLLSIVLKGPEAVRLSVKGKAMTWEATASSMLWKRGKAMCCFSVLWLLLELTHGNTNWIYFVKILNWIRSSNSYFKPCWEPHFIKKEKSLTLCWSLRHLSNVTRFRQSFLYFLLILITSFLYLLECSFWNSPQKLMLKVDPHFTCCRIQLSFLFLNELQNGNVSGVQAATSNSWFYRTE